jgi:type 1 glutamine amidotransferase
VVWTHNYGTGRVVYDALGHDVESLSNPEHARLLRQSLAWIVGRNR